MTLHLTLKKKWFDMIVSGEKKEEYREIKDYWAKRLTHFHSAELADMYKDRFRDGGFKYYDNIVFRNGYSKNASTAIFEFKGVYIGKAVPEWSDNWQGDVFVIKIGKRL